MLKRISDKKIREAAYKDSHIGKIVKTDSWECIALAQLEADQKELEAVVREIFGEIEDKAHHISPSDLIEPIRVNIDWLDWQALKDKYLGRIKYGDF